MFQPVKVQNFSKNLLKKLLKLGASYFQDSQFYLNDQDHRYGYNGLFMWTRCVCIEGKIIFTKF